jgi:Na+-transporting NADH:ubiquinone oxidoreductase subunit NqrC
METMYFVLGVLSIIATAIVCVMVWGIVKINKQQQWLDSIQRQLNEEERMLKERIAEIYREIDQRASWIHTRVDVIDANHTRRMDQEHETIYREIGDCRAYVDSRIDKASSLTGAKQLIKG